MLTEQDPNSHQQWFGIGTFVGGAIAAIMAKVHTKFSRPSDEHLERLVRRILTEEKKWDGVNRRLEDLERHHPLLTAR